MENFKITITIKHKPKNTSLVRCLCCLYNYLIDLCEEQENREEIGKNTLVYSLQYFTHHYVMLTLSLPNSDQSGKIKIQIEDNRMDVVLDGGQCFDNVSKSHIRAEHCHLFKNTIYSKR